MKNIEVSYVVEYDYDKWKEAFENGSPKLIEGYEKLRDFAWTTYLEERKEECKIPVARTLYLLARLELIAGYAEEKNGACFRNPDPKAPVIYVRRLT